MKVIQQINETDFVIRMEKEYDKPRKYAWDTKVHFVHDYIQFDTYSSIFTEGKLRLDSDFNIAINSLTIPVSAQVSIYDMYKIILPMLKDCKYLQPEHFAKREDGSYGYTYGASAIQYRDFKTGALMVAFKDSGEREYSRVTKKVYDEYMYPAIVSKMEERYKVDEK